LKEITSDEIIHIHERVVKKFNITGGIINRGLIDAVVKRPMTQIGDSYIPFDNPYKKAASLIEGIIRWHPFADGNKRTALLVMIYYLSKEEYGVALPLSAVRFTVEIAKNEKTDAKDTKKLIKKISNWIENHSGKSYNEIRGKLFIQLTLPYNILSFLYRIGFHSYVENKLNRWLAFDIYPEYEQEADKIVEFIADSLKDSIDMYLDTVNKRLDKEKSKN